MSHGLFFPRRPLRKARAAIETAKCTIARVIVHVARVIIIYARYAARRIIQFIGSHAIYLRWISKGESREVYAPFFQRRKIHPTRYVSSTGVVEITRHYGSPFFPRFSSMRDRGEINDRNIYIYSSTRRMAITMIY